MLIRPNGSGTSNASLTLERISSHIVRATVQVPSLIVRTIYERAIDMYRHHLKPRGLEAILITNEYIMKYHRIGVEETVKRFILKYFALDFLAAEFAKQPLLAVHRPRLVDVIIFPEYEMQCIFDVSVNDYVPLKEWKMFPFKPPRRKLYKDLDKQVEAFIDRETVLYRQLDHAILQDGDWVCFEVAPLDHENKPLPGIMHQRFWMRLNTSYVASKFHTAFVGKRVGDVFIVHSLPLDDHLGEIISEQSHFNITVINIVKGAHFSLDVFRAGFRLKNRVDIHRKLIEVFSFRNDVSQRKSIIDEVFQLLFSKHRFEIAKHLVLRKQEELIETLRRVPDFYVYRAQKDFDQEIASLAEKQLKEEVLMDQLAHEERVRADDIDIQAYLNFFTNDRLKEFIYFKPSNEFLEESEIPLNDSLMRLTATREKTLNHVISHLTR